MVSSKTLILITVALAIVAIVIYFLQRPRGLQPFEQMESVFALRTLQAAQAYTYDRDPETGKYLNYYTRDKRTRREEHPLTLPNGTPWKVNTQHGQLYNQDESGYQIHGISSSFTCPKGTVWNGNQKLCVSKNVKCAFEGMVLPYLNSEGQAHERLYIYCTETGYRFEQCPFGTYFERKAVGCIPYDICEGELNGFTFKSSRGECFVCNDGKRVKIDCSP